MLPIAFIRSVSFDMGKFMNKKEAAQIRQPLISFLYTSKDDNSLSQQTIAGFEILVAQLANHRVCPRSIV